MINEISVRKAIEEAGIDVDKDMPINDKFTDHGFDSLDLFGLIVQLQELTGEEIPDDHIDALDSIANILTYYKS